MDDFEKKLTIAGFSEQTITGHVGKVKQFFDAYKTFSKDNVESFLFDLKKKGYTNNSVNAYLKALKKYENTYQVDEIKCVKYLPKNRSTVSVLSSDELRRFMQLTSPFNIDYGAIKGFKMWSVYFAVMMFTGARCGEVDRLTVDDIDFGRDVIQLDGRKTKSPRDIPIQSELRKLLEWYIKKLDRDELFINTSAQERGRQFRLRLEQLGIKRKGLTAYSLRHSFATRMIETDNVSLFDVKSLMGHSDIKTTEQYYHRSAKRLKKAITKDPLSVKSKKDTLELLRSQIEECIKQYKINEYKIKAKDNHLLLDVEL